MALETKCQENARAIAQQMKNSGGGSGSEVTVTQVLASGTKIATIKVDDASTDLYCETVPATPEADDIVYDNTDSGLTATNVQDAIDEIAQGGSGGTTWTLVGTQTGTTAQAISGYSEYYVKIAPNDTHIMEVIILASELSSTSVNYRQGGLLANDNYWGCALICTNASLALGSVVVNGSDVTSASTMTVYGR